MARSRDWRRLLKRLVLSRADDEPGAEERLIAESNHRAQFAAIEALSEEELCRPVRVVQRSECYAARTLGIGEESAADIDSDVSNRSISGSLEEYHISELHQVPRYRSSQYRLHRCRSRKIDSE